MINPTFFKASNKLGLLWCLIFLGACNAQKSEKDFIIFGEDKFATIINGNPKQVNYFTYKPKILNDGTINKGDFLMSPGHLMGLGYRYHFNRKGHMEKAFEYYDGDSIPTHMNLWTYIRNDRIKYEKKQGSPPYPENGYMAANNFSLDSLGHDGKKVITEEYWRYYSEESDTIIAVTHRKTYYKYDEKGNLIEEKIEDFDFDDVSTDPSNYKMHLDKTDVITYHTEYRDGKLYRYGKEKPYFVYTYDEDGNKVKEEIEKYGYYTEYYPNGIVKKMYYGEDSYQEQNEEGYVTKSVLDSNTTYEVQYDQFDEYENWTRVIVYKNGTPTEYGERNITYYE